MALTLTASSTSAELVDVRFSLDWIPGSAEEFGMFSINYDHYQPAGFTHGLGIGMNFNFLCGTGR